MQAHPSHLTESPISSSRITTSHLVVLEDPEKPSKLPSKRPRKFRFEPFKPIRHWLDEIQIHDRKLARLFARLIPAQCPFERDIIMLGRKVGHIPPLCKFNPFYEELVALRFRALCYLVDQCGEDIQAYC